ncbi:MAG: response regulator transcription factor [Actinomycetota bacterium]|nr:response regulator transcription factor [Actinomycetota bacterium]
MTVRLAIVDGQTLVRFGLRHISQQHPDIQIVAECSSAPEALRSIQQVGCDVVTVASSLPDGDGMELVRDLRRQHPGLGIVVLAARDSTDAMLLAMEHAASAFVAKSAPMEEIVGAIRHASVAPLSFTASGLAAALARRQAALALSPREIEVLRLLRDGLSVPAIAQAMYISYSTAKTYVARLYEKLGATNRSQALITALRRGLIDYDHDGDDAARQAPARTRRHRPARVTCGHGPAAELDRWPPRRPAGSRSGRLGEFLPAGQPPGIGGGPDRPSAHGPGWSRPGRWCWRSPPTARGCFRSMPSMTSTPGGTSPPTGFPRSTS